MTRPLSLRRGAQWMDNELGEADPIRAVDGLTLAVGCHADIPDLLRAGLLPDPRRTRIAGFRALVRSGTGLGTATTVLTPVIGAEFDAMDMAGLLDLHGFRGRYLAYGLDLPKPALLRDEIRAAWPRVAFNLVVLDRVAPLARRH
ncbi:hypothetical protein [Maritimibacter sp. 55A14]|uniref:hypothetical protein n=1 Tax=Maritimibacter sp. 55A14 TaxID=2174844 RepID=UPI0011B29CF9|nr:hypothetical protein [Maritimibacter sp. 55A14]